MYKGLECCVVIVAGGSGSRFGGEVSKQFLMLGDMPVLSHSLNAFLGNKLIDSIVVVCAKGDIDQAHRVVNNADTQIIPGGATRQESVYCAVKFLENIGFDGLVIVHDAARPFVNDDVVEMVLKAAYEHGSATTATAVTDTIKVVQNGLSSQTLNRAELFAVQTPQGFKSHILFDAHNALAGFEGYDDCQLTEKNGHSTKIVQGCSDNIKITHKSDMAQAEAILKKRGGLNEIGI